MTWLFISLFDIIYMLDVMIMDLVKEHMSLIKKDLLTNLKEYAIFILIIIGYLLFFFLIDPHGPNCLIQRTIGIPCMCCGMTRATFYLVTLDIQSAFHFHPLVFIMPLIGLTILLKGYGIFSKLFNSKIFWATIIVLFVVTYTIRMYYYFPETEPMDFYSKALLFN